MKYFVTWIIIIHTALMYIFFFPLAYHGIRVMVYEEDTIEAKEILGLFFKEK